MAQVHLSCFFGGKLSLAQLLKTWTKPTYSSPLLVSYLKALIQPILYLILPNWSNGRAATWSLAVWKLQVWFFLIPHPLLISSGYLGGWSTSWWHAICSSRVIYIYRVYEKKGGSAENQGRKIEPESEKSVPLVGLFRILVWVYHSRLGFSLEADLGVDLGVLGLYLEPISSELPFILSLENPSSSSSLLNKQEVLCSLISAFVFCIIAYCFVRFSLP